MTTPVTETSKASNKETLAPGAPAAQGMMPLCVPQLSGNEWKYVKECLDTNWVSSVGPFVDRLEQEAARRLGVAHAVAVVNGTAALHLALLAAGVEANDEVLVSDLTFIAPVNAIRYVGAWPVLIGPSANTWQMDASKVVDFLTKECHWKNGNLWNKTSGRRVKAVIPVHILGSSVDLDPILEVARNFNLPIIEDATEGLGASYHGRPLGSLGEAACLSFNGNKIITTGGGGMLLSSNAQWAAKVKYLSTQAKDDPIEYVHNEIGFNYRLTNVLAALGVAQFEQLDSFVAKKRVIAKRYDQALGGIEGLTVMPRPAGVDQTFWLYTILWPKGTSLSERQAVVSELNRKGIGSRPLWRPAHLLAPYQKCQAYYVDEAQDLYCRAVSLPSSVGLSSQDQDRCIEAVCRIFNQ